MRRLIDNAAFISAYLSLAYAFVAVITQAPRYMVGADFIAAGALLLLVVNHRLTSD